MNNLNHIRLINRMQEDDDCGQRLCDLWRDYDRRVLKISLGLIILSVLLWAVALSF